MVAKFWEDGAESGGWGDVGLLLGLLLVLVLFVIAESGWGSVVVGFCGEGGRVWGGWRGCSDFFGGVEESAEAVPAGKGVGVGEEVVGGFELQRSEGLAGALEEVDVSGLEGEGDGLSEIDAGVFELTVDEERDGDEARGGGVVEVAGPLVDSDGAGDLRGGCGLAGLGVEGREQQRGAQEQAADGGPGVHACDLRRGG